MFEIGIIGSCRVYDPLLHSSFSLNQKHIYGFTHNTKEHLQLLTLGLKGSPDTQTLAEITCIPCGYRGFESESIEGRYYVVEISSVRVVEYQGWILQINRFFKFCTQYSPVLLNALSFSSEDALRHGLSQCTDLPMNIDEINFYEQSEDEIAADIIEIHRILNGKVIFVSHFDTDQFGNSITQRRKIINAMSTVSIRNGIKIFDPTPHLKAFGIEKAVIDLGHYTPEFQTEMSKILSHEVNGLVDEFRGAE